MVNQAEPIAEMRRAVARRQAARRRARRLRRRGDRGLTLLELMVVLVIIGLIAAIAAPQLIGYLDRSRVDTARIQIRELSTIADMYRLDVGRFPTESEGLRALVEQPPGVDRWRGPYLKTAASLTDPWGNPYVHRVGPNGRSVVIGSLGADGTEGGDGLDADIFE